MQSVSRTDKLDVRLAGERRGRHGNNEGQLS